MKLEQIKFRGVLASERLILRKLTNEDRTKLFEIYTHEESALYDDWIPFTDIKEADDMIVNSVTSFSEKSEIRYGIIDKESDTLVGSCGIFGFDDWNMKCTLFYQVHHLERNKGYASESVRLLLDYAFSELEFNRLEAYITPGNDSSIRVLEKNGFVREGLLREMEFYKDRYWDGILMAILRKDYKPK